MNDVLRIGLPAASFLPNFGGAEVGLHNIAKRLQQRGHMPVVMTSWAHAHKLKRDGWQLPYPVLSFPPKILSLLYRAPALAFAFSDLVYGFWQQKWSFDVWHATFGYPTGVMLAHYAARARQPVPHLVRCVGDDIQKSAEIGYGMRLNPDIDAIVTRELPRAQRLSGTCETVVREYEALGVPRSRISVVPNGVDVARFMQRGTNPVRAQLGIPDGAFLALSVGRYHQKKNFRLAIRAVAALPAELRRKHKLHLVIAGTDVRALEAEVQACGIADIVRLVEPGRLQAQANGSIDLPDTALLNCYQTADAFIMPSLLETFGTVLVEAMAAGLPVISTDAPGCIDVMRNGRDALMVPSNDVDAMSGAIARLLEEPGLRDALAAKANERAIEFDWDTVVDRYLDLYRTVIEEARATTMHRN